MRIRSQITGDHITEADVQTAKIADALAHPLRVALVKYLKAKNGGKGVDNETCNKDLVEMFNYSQSTMSQHVKVLVNCGLFITESKDKFTFYYLDTALLDTFKRLLDF